MFRWISLFGVRYHQSKARRPKETVKLRVEGLEDRTMPSVSVPNPLAFEAVASPPPVPSMAAVATYLASTMDQWTQFITTVQQDVLAAWKMLGQEIAQEVSVIQQRWDRLVGINPNAPNPSLNSTVPHPGSDSGTGRGNSSGSGSGSSASTTHNSPNQPLNNPTQQSGSGSGSGSSTTTYPIASGQGGMVHPLTSGSGTGSGIAGAGTGSVGNGTGSGPATVYGQVWLDNNGDGSIDNGEQGYQGITVNLLVENPDGSYTPGWSTTTNASGGYQFNITEGPAPGHSYKVQVVLNSVPYVNFQATLPGVSQINARGISAAFNLANGGWRDIEAGICSMEVTTTQDDPTSPYQDEVTLRDAIETGNNGDGQHQNNFLAVTFVNPQTGQPLGGTITLQAVLPAIEESYNIVGPGAADLTVNGNANPGSVYTIDAGVTSTISGETIKNGSPNGSGGGVFNNGNLTLVSDTVTNNKAGASGGGAFNAAGATLTVQNTDITGNTATNFGGGIANYGTLITNQNTQITGTNKANLGGGIANAGSAATAKLEEGTLISGNTASTKGGGIYNSGGKLTMADTTFGQSGGIDQNSANSGGGLYVVSGSVTIGDYITIYKNQATNGAGGGVYISAGNVKISGGTIEYNTATPGFGGGIYTKGGTLTLASETIGPKNAANMGKGGGMYLAGGSTTNFVNNVTVSGGNTAKSALAGNGIYDQNGAGAVVQANGAVVNPKNLGPPFLTDKDDGGGTPKTGA
jgi:hypothetical protein